MELLIGLLLIAGTWGANEQIEFNKNIDSRVEYVEHNRIDFQADKLILEDQIKKLQEKNKDLQDQIFILKGKLEVEQIKQITREAKDKIRIPSPDPNVELYQRLDVNAKPARPPKEDK